MKKIVPGLLFVLSLSASASAFAQNVPDAGQLLNERQPRFEFPNFFGTQEEPETTPAPEKTDATVAVKSFRFTGAEGIATDEELQALVADSIGKDLSFGDLQALAETISAYLRKKGWPLAQAYLPRQDVTEGDIEINILQGRIEEQGAVVVAPETRLSQNIIKKTIDNALPGEGKTPSQKNLERGVLLINDMPGMTARTTLERGEQPGSSRLIVNAEEGPWVTGNVTADNFGNRYTGALTLTPTVNVNDPLGIGDQVTFSGAHSKASGLDLAKLGYSLPVGTSGLRANVSYSHLWYTLDRTLAQTDSNGSASVLDTGLSYPFMRSRGLSLWGGAGYTHKNLTDEVSGTKTADRKLNNANINVSASASDTLGGGGMNSFLLGATAGDLDRSGVTSDLQSDRTTARSDGHFMKFTASAARLQHITDDISFFTALRGQWANKNLDSSEKLILGGPSGVRAYPVGEASGDEGWLANFEVRYDVPLDLRIGRLQLVGFADFGGIKLNDNPWTGAVSTATGRNSYTLSGAGLGANLSGGDRYELRMSWATALGDNPGRSTSGQNADGRDRNNTFWLQGVLKF